ncbi:hypothetical protein OIU34_22935 [Pararhizobium sp. BT-229]|uniref:hypothetical protein n=1 Tax=Pararhizobium sp. BT-229 TaxID=2986923 RepID=UPI0021F6B384|nr:hypothetical protein [Pararhizobium sp. BT-229]MCV9964751.1 hypothetical protein [Pararhizobium sp. BT-229]
MSNTEKTITITWRDENYGSVSHSVAFRAMGAPLPSETEKKKIVRAYRNAGFELNFNRQTWIAKKSIETAPATLIQNLENLGYEVTNRGRTPAILEEAKPAAPSPAAPKL